MELRPITALSASRKFDSDREIKLISSLIHKKMSESGANGVVVGISGGIDSAVVASLCKKALGAKRVLGVFLFEENSRKSQDMVDAKLLAKCLGIKTLDIPISNAIDAIAGLLGKRASRLTFANIKARTRMVILYALANQRNLLVAGTGDRSESLIGYFTKYGDGGVDFLPIGHLYKTEVRALGAVLQVPFNIITKPSSPNLWPNHKASDELPADYDILDRVLTLIFDSKMRREEIRSRTGVSDELIDKVIKLNRASEHKRQLPSSI